VSCNGAGFDVMAHVDGEKTESVRGGFEREVMQFDEI